ncbi:hypothetical protein KBC54_04750 [Patescibacteria group bacterium]|nr:hypothetical protein [Patescibacteria group bacterium]
MFPFQNSNEYLLFVKKFYSLVDLQLSRAEKMAEKQQFHDIVPLMPGIVSMVLSVYYLRGEDGFFLNDRPQPLGDTQKELYQMQDAVGIRLQKLVNAIGSGSQKEYDEYLERITQYLVRANARRVE